MGNAPALGNIKAELFAEDFCCLASDGIAPGAELRQLISVAVKGQISVHHTGNAHSANGGEFDSEFGLHVLGQLSKAAADADVNGIHTVSPDSIYQLILPVMTAGSNGLMVFIQQNGFDTGGS